MARKKKSPCGEIFIALFLFVYCWGTLWYWIYAEWLEMAFKKGIMAFWFRFLIYSLIPIFFARWVYKYNKKYFDELFGKFFKK